MAQIHVFTGVERRRRWSDEQKREIVAAAFAPGAKVAEVARGGGYQQRLDLSLAAISDGRIVLRVCRGRREAARLWPERSRCVGD